MATGKAVSGAAAVLFLGGSEVGWCTGVSAQETVEYVPIEALGDIDVKGHEPIRRTVSMSASFVRIKNESLKQQAIWSKGETGDVIAFEEMEAILIDTTDGTPIFKIEGVYPQTRNWQVQKGSIITVNATFYAKRMTDETG